MHDRHDPYVDAGADEVQEIAWMLTGVAMLRALEVAGLPVERAAATIGFRVAADADQFLTIAGCVRPDPRGGRYSPPVESTPPVAAPCRHVACDVLADVAVNMLRSTSAAFGAGVGGADW